MGPAFLVTYVWKKHELRSYKFNQEFPKPSVVWREIKLHAQSVVHFVIYDGLVAYLYLSGYTLIYSDSKLYGGWPYMILSFFGLLLLHDTYFYWTHRLMHMRSFSWIKHQTHHYFHNPTPWSSFSISFFEGQIQILFHLLVVFVLPLNLYTIAAYLMFSMISNTIGHSGYLIGNANSRVWSNSRNHYFHHLHSQCNFGLYFVFWDKLMQTSRTE